MEKEDFTEEQKVIIERDYKGKSVKEVLDTLSKRPMRKYERFNFSFQRITMLEDFADLINKYSSELKNLGSKAIKSMGEEVLASQLLGEYVILEVWSFYDMILKIEKDEKINLSDLPPYWEDIKDFRNQIVAHLDKDGRFRTLKEWIEQYEKINKIGMPLIVEDFKRIYAECYKNLKGRM
jgi:hypothetical protein